MMTSKKPDVASHANRLRDQWRENKYYDAAEDWTFLFWERPHPFRPFFDELNPGRFVELAVGHGRHANQAKEFAAHLTLVDLVPENIEQCKMRFKHVSNVDFAIGNGFDFDCIDTESVDSIYCYDAMVHFPAPVVLSYIKDTFRILKAGGMALYHHSNSEAAPEVDADQTPHGRAHMSASKFASASEAAGLTVVKQQVIKWGAISALDCITLLRKPPNSEVTRAKY